MKPLRSFASDNNSGIHPKILKAIEQANVGHCVAYGDDPYTARALKQFKEHFGQEAEVFFVFNGTGANVLALQALTESFNAVICSELAHIYADECGAPEKFTGSKLIPISTADGKLTIESIKPHLGGIGDQHHVQPKVISITQSTELGTVYTVAEIRALCDFAHQHGMYVHMDGARLANAAASLNVGLKQVTAEAGIDALSFGGTKNGLLAGEAVVFFRPELAKNFKFIRKQGMQLSSKTRFISAQFLELFNDDLWLKNASHANQMARLLESEARRIPGVSIVQKVEANAVFAALSPELVAKLKDRYFFYVWNERRCEVRWVASFDTAEQDIHDFVNFAKECANRK